MRQTVKVLTELEVGGESEGNLVTLECWRLADGTDVAPEGQGVNLYALVYAGLVEVVELDPSAPVDHSADFLTPADQTVPVTIDDAGQAADEADAE